MREFKIDATATYCLVENKYSREIWKQSFLLATLKLDLLNFCFGTNFIDYYNNNDID